jgi:hypothetical protein
VVLGALIVGAGCQTAGPVYRTQTTVKPADTPGQYLVEMKLSKTSGGKTSLLSAPRLLVAEDQPATVEVGDEQGQNGIRVDIKVSRTGQGPRALIETQVKEKGKVVWTSKETVPVTS